jgi:hypothetical protein
MELKRFLMFLQGAIREANVVQESGNVTVITWKGLAADLKCLSMHLNCFVEIGL